MKCPKCGCGIRKGAFCPYCKITADEVIFASNVEAKKRIKAKDTEDVYTSSYIPFDVSKKKLFFVTFFGGLLGFDAYYLGRYKRAIIQFATIVLAFIMYTLSYVLGYTVLRSVTDILGIASCIFLVMWIGNTFRVLMNKATVPVVLPTADELSERKAKRDDEEKAKADAKEARSKAKYNKMVEKEKKNLEKKESKSKTDEK